MILKLIAERVEDWAAAVGAMNSKLSKGLGEQCDRFGRVGNFMGDLGFHLGEQSYNQGEQKKKF